MANLDDKNAAQAASWNGDSGRVWTERQAFMDRLLAPVSEVLFASLDLTSGMRVIDIGCGSGGTTLDLAQRVAPTGQVLGLDISAPMLMRARERSPAGTPVLFVEADATIYPFEPEAAGLLVSRFGVMFFAEPTVAFANMRRGLKPGGRVAFACWRAPDDNPYFSLALDAARNVLPPQPPLDIDAPGPFAFADGRKVERVLTDAGFTGIALRPVDVMFDAGAGGGLDAAVESALQIGPASRALQDQPEAVRAEAAAAIRSALAAHETADGVMVEGRIWIVTARNPS